MRHSREIAIRRFRAPPGAGAEACLTQACLVLVCLALASPALADAPPPPDGPLPRTFFVGAYDVDGATLLPQLAIEKAVYPFLGPDRTSADVDRARAALEKAYHDLGYQSVVVEIPAQPISEVIRLHVVEAPVGRLRVVGSRYFSPEAIRRQTPSLAEGKVPDFNEAQKELTDVNRLGDPRVAPVLRAGVAPGTVDVDLKVSDTLPWHASVELNNDHSQNTSPLRLSATTHYDNLWQLGHSVTFTYSVAPENPSNQQVFYGSYLAPLWGTPWSLLVFGYDSNSNVAALGGTTVLGKGYDIGQRGIVQGPRIGPFAQSLSLGFDFKHFDQDVTLDGVTTPTPITYVPFNATYTLQSANAKSSARISLGATVGLRGLGSDTAAFEYARFNAQPNFMHFNLDARFTQALGAGIEADARITGQVADQPLVSNEQFAAGGFTSVRGYLQSEAVGDDGVFGSLEIVSPSVQLLPVRYVQDLRVYGFGDAAELWVIDPLSGQTPYFDLYSVGLGLRFEILKYLKGDVALATPLTGGVVTPKYRPRATFSLKSEF